MIKGMVRHEDTREYWAELCRYFLYLARQDRETGWLHVHWLNRARQARLMVDQVNG